MAVTTADMQKPRRTTDAGLVGCKKALTEAVDGMDRAVGLVRERGPAIAAKRPGRETSNGCVLVKVDKDFATMIALKCETDFVANGKDFIEYTQNILDTAVAVRAKTVDEILISKLADGKDVATTVKLRSGITSEKMELDGYRFLEGENIEAYSHMDKNILCTMVQTSKPVEEQAHNITMQAAAMNPVVLNEESASQEVKGVKYKVAVEKIKEEQVEKAVIAVLKKAGFNLYIAESEEYMEEGFRKGETTAEQADGIRKIKAETVVDKKEHLQESMTQNTTKGRMNKFSKKNCSLNQEYIQDSRITVSEYSKRADKDLSVVDFKYFSLRVD